MKIFVNLLSVSRILASFAIVPLLLGQYFLTALIVFVLASASDWVDGFLARKYNVCTKIGGVLDHIGDKFLVVNALIMVMIFLQIWSVIFPAIFMICRELYVSGLREFMGTNKIEMPVPKARFSFGKVKTFTQMLALVMVFVWIWSVNADIDSEFLAYDLLFVSIGAMWVATFFSVISAVQYTVTFIKNLKKIK